MLNKIILSNFFGRFFPLNANTDESRDRLHSDKKNASKHIIVISNLSHLIFIGFNARTLYFDQPFELPILKF